MSTLWMLPLDKAVETLAILQNFGLPLRKPYHPIYREGNAAMRALIHLSYVSVLDILHFTVMKCPQLSNLQRKKE